MKFIHILKNLQTKLIRIFPIIIGMTICSSLFAQIAEPLSPADSKDTINVPKKKSSIEHAINYDAVDSIWFNVAKQEATLYGKAHLDYDEISIDAPIVIVDLKNSMLEAKATYDSTGKIDEWPLLTQKDDKFQAQTIIFNYKTSRGYIEDVYMQEGEGYLHTNQAYLDENKTIFVDKGSYTTCNLAKPHYHFKMNKAKVIPEDKIIASMVNLYIDSIPTPLGVPFGLFPTKDRQSAGILLPSNYGESQLGFFLKDFGYYLPINDSLALTFKGEIYSKGSYTISNLTDYKIRYKFSGKFKFDYRNVLYNNDEFNNSSKKLFTFDWNHSPVARNGRSMRADVHLEPVVANRFSSTQNTQFSNPQNNSSVVLQLPLRGIPFMASVSLKHTQNKTANNGAGSNTFNLPNFTVSYNGERNPYKLIPYTSPKPSLIRKKLLDQFSISYNMSGNSLLNTDKLKLASSDYQLEALTNPNDTVNLALGTNSVKELLERNKFSMSHSATIQNNIKLKYFTFTPSFSYNEYWFFNQSNFDVNFADTSYKYVNNPGFYRISRYKAGASLSTSIYNFYTLGRVKTSKADSTKMDNQIKFRHQMTPSLNFSTSPNYNNDAALYDIFVEGNKTASFDRYFLYQGKPSTSGKSQSIGFSLTNIFEVKTPEKKANQLNPDFVAKPRTPYKIIQLSGSASYNLAADSMNLSNIGLTASNTNLLNGLMGFTASASLDPYQYDSIGDRLVRVNRYWAQDNKSLARLSLFQINSNLNLNPKVFQKKSPKDTSKTSYFNYPGYIDFDLPWTLQLNYNYNVSEPTPTSLTSKSSSMAIYGSLKLSEKWSTTYSVNYNFTSKQFTSPNIGLNRDLHCWILRLQWAPFGPSYQRSYSFFIGVKADMLKDLKILKQRSPYDRINF